MREGLVPAVLGTAVTASGVFLKEKLPAVGWGVVGFGLAHVVLGAIDLVEHRRSTH
ncbi:asparagine synthase [Paenibacillus sp. y28]|uniref:asparagine synthase n=1 Tax=Paenibacillus sp. y28 TaxID=3129110 RepID=UPI0030173BEC